MESAGAGSSAVDESAVVAPTQGGEEADVSMEAGDGATAPAGHQRGGGSGGEDGSGDEDEEDDADDDDDEEETDDDDDDADGCSYLVISAEASTKVLAAHEGSLSMLDNEVRVALHLVVFLLLARSCLVTCERMPCTEHRFLHRRPHHCHRGAV